LALVYGLIIIANHHSIPGIPQYLFTSQQSQHQKTSEVAIVTFAWHGWHGVLVCLVQFSGFRLQAQNRQNRSRVQRVAPKNEALLRAQSEDEAQLSTAEH